MLPLAYRRLLGFGTVWGTQIIWIFSSFRVCSRIPLRMSRCAMTCWTVISASALRRWALPFWGSKIQPASLCWCCWCACGLRGAGLEIRTPSCAQWWSWEPKWWCGTALRTVRALSVHLASAARAQAELGSGYIHRLADLAQDETIMEHKWCHFEYSNIGRAEVTSAMEKCQYLQAGTSVRVTFRMIPSYAH